MTFSNHANLYRFTVNGEGVWSAGKRLLPEALVTEAEAQRKWLPKPILPKGEYIFLLTEGGKRQYENTLMRIHEKYLEPIVCEVFSAKQLGEIVYRDEWQVVVRKLIAVTH